LLQAEVIKSVSDLDFKIMEKSHNCVLKTINAIVSILFEYEIKKAEDVYEVAYKIFQYPYDISSHAFVPLGAPNTWSQLVCFIDWLTTVAESYVYKDDEKAIEEESNDDEFRRSSLDRHVDMESSSFFDHIPNAPLLPKNGDFMKYVEKMRIQK